MTTIIQRRLETASKDIIEQHQCGFTRGRATTDAIHTVKQIIEKSQELNIDIELLFIDFKQAFDSIKRGRLMAALKELGIEAKPRRLVKMTMSESTTTIVTQKGETREFVINKGVRQGDTLSATLFNLTLEYVMRRINKGRLRTRGGSNNRICRRLSPRNKKQKNNERNAR